MPAMDRRHFILGTAAAALHASLLSPGIARPRSSSARSMAASAAISSRPSSTSTHFSSLKLTWAMISLPPPVLGRGGGRAVHDHADRLGIKLQLALRHRCARAARSFNAQNGTVEEQVGAALKASQIFGARCMRCVLGGDPERPQIEMHIDNMVKAVRGIRSRIVDSGIKLAVENHGGDLQAREMKMMVEAVGTDVMGVCLDSGNPVWMLEDPHMTLEMLLPYAETSHVRDSAVWKVPEGIAVRWVNMGEGNVDIDGWIRKFVEAKPGMPIIFENLVSGNPRVHAIYDPKFWDNWQQDAGVGVQPLPGRRREGQADAGDTAAGGKDRGPAAHRRPRRLHEIHAEFVAAHLISRHPARRRRPHRLQARE